MQTKITFFVVLAATLACSLTEPFAEATSTVSPVAVATSATVEKTATRTTAPAPFFCVVSSDVLHLRACGSMSCAAEDWLRRGTRLEIVEDNGAWLNVKTPSGETGWVKKEYCNPNFGG